MFSNINITLRIPNAHRPERQFSVRLQTDLNNESCTYQDTSRLFVVSNIKGNFRAFYKLLIKYKIVDKYFNWSFKDGHLVVLGNCFDIEDPATESLWLIYSLEQKAKREGGYVHFILGTNEIMHINGKWRYSHPPYALTGMYPNQSFTALYNANHELWRWLTKKNIVEKIGNLLFINGGISPAIVSSDYSIEYLNTLARSFYTRLPEVSTDVLSAILYSDEPYTHEQINAALAKFNVKTIITGHAMQEQVPSLLDGKVINVSTDHTSVHSGGLIVKRGEFYWVDRQGQKNKLKDN